MAREELASFLRERRESLRPGDAGLPAGSRRRTPGLRREEIADRARMSVEYYALLEQARGPRPSPAILHGIATALHLTSAERIHVFHLAGVTPPAPPGPSRQVRPYVRSLLERMPDTAAIVTAANYDVIAWSPLAGALMHDTLTGPVPANTVPANTVPTNTGPSNTGPPNMARNRFLRPGRSAVQTGLEEFGEIVVARLRAAAARYPADPGLAGLVTELRAGSDEFTALWDTHPVRVPGHRTKIISHPETGPLRVNCDVLTVPDDDQQVVFMTADPGSPSARAIRHLAAGSFG